MDHEQGTDESDHGAVDKRLVRPVVLKWEQVLAHFALNGLQAVRYVNDLSLRIKRQAADFEGYIDADTPPYNCYGGGAAIDKYRVVDWSELPPYKMTWAQLDTLIWLLDNGAN